MVKKRVAVKRKRLVVSSSSSGDSDVLPETRSEAGEGMESEDADPSAAPAAGEGGAGEEEAAFAPVWELLESCLSPESDCFGEGASWFARSGFRLRCPDNADRVCRPRPREAGIYHPCIAEMGLRFPFPPFFLMILHVMGIPFYRLTANSTANVIGFIILCRLLNITPTVGLFRFFFHTVLNPEGYYGIQARRGRKLIQELERKVRDWKEQFAFLVCPEGAAMPGPAVLDLTDGGLEWMNADPDKLLTNLEEASIRRLRGVKEDEREFAELISGKRIKKFVWEQQPLMEPDLAEMLKSIAESRQKESEKRIDLARRRALGSSPVGVVIRDVPPGPPKAPPGLRKKPGRPEPATVPGPAQVPPVSPALGAVAGPPQAPVIQPTSPPVDQTTPRTPQGLDATTRELAMDVPRHPPHATLLAGGSGRPTRKRRRGEEFLTQQGVDTEETGCEESIDAAPRSPILEAVTEEPQNVVEPSATELTQPLLKNSAASLSAAIKESVNVIFTDEEEELRKTSQQAQEELLEVSRLAREKVLEASQRARERVLKRCLKLGETCYSVKVELATEKREVARLEEKLRATTVDALEARAADLQGRLDASEVEAEKALQDARASEAALRLAEASLADVRTQLCEEREKRKHEGTEAAQAAAQAANTITSLRKTIILRDTKIAELEAAAEASRVRMEGWEVLAAKVPGLEAQIAKGAELEAQKIEAARKEARRLFVKEELPGQLKQSMETGAVQGRAEGLQVGFYQALRTIIGLHPELKDELSKLSVQDAPADPDEAAVADPRGQDGQGVEESAGQEDEGGEGKEATETTEALPEESSDAPTVAADSGGPSP